MIKRSHIFFISIFFLMINMLQAQKSEKINSSSSTNTDKGILFGKDIIINNKPTQSQHNIAICTAFNGWLYAIIGYKDPAYGTFPSITFLKSTDSGQTWSILLDSYYPLVNAEFAQLDIITNGKTEGNLNFIVATVITSNGSRSGAAHVDVYDGITGSWKHNLYTGYCYDIALASDEDFPSYNSDPNSIGVLYSKYYQGIGDSLILRSSSYGDSILNNKTAIYGTSNYLYQVDLAYGRSLSWPQGRYFAVWEELDNPYTFLGKIFTCHSEPYFNSPFTLPVPLNGLDSLNFNLCRNPSIACQSNNVDNANFNLTEIILFDKYNSANQQFDIQGYYNLQATNSTNFVNLNISDSLHSNMYSDICFNSIDTTFVVTYFDSTSQKLPLFTNNFNLTNPNQWVLITDHYNDTSSLTEPYPKVTLNKYLHSENTAWVADRNNGNGVGMFDRTDNFWTQVSDINRNYGTMKINVYPNPCSNIVTFAFELNQKEEITIEILNILSQRLLTIEKQHFQRGPNFIQCNLHEFSSGTYLFRIKSKENSTNGLLYICK